MKNSCSTLVENLWCKRIKCIPTSLKNCITSLLEPYKGNGITDISYSASTRYNKALNCVPAFPSYFVWFGNFNSPLIFHLGRRKHKYCWPLGLFAFSLETFSVRSLPFPFCHLLSWTFPNSRLPSSWRVCQGTSICSLSMKRWVYDQ